VYLKRDGGRGGILPCNIFGGHISVCRQRIYRYTKGKGTVVLNHKPTKVLRLSTSNLGASHRPDTEYASEAG